MAPLLTAPSRIPRFVRALDGRVKIALLMAFSVALFWAHSLSALAAAAALLAAVMAFGQVRWAAVLKGGAPAYVIAAFLLVYNGMSLGWTAGTVVAARVLLLVWGSLVLVSLATATELSEALRRLLAPLGRVGLPVRDVTTAFSIALRFIPLTAEELAGVRAAQASRGASFQGAEGSACGLRRAHGAAVRRPVPSRRPPGCGHGCPLLRGHCGAHDPRRASFPGKRRRGAPCRHRPVHRRCARSLRACGLRGGGGQSASGAERKGRGPFPTGLRPGFPRARAQGLSRWALRASRTGAQARS